MAKNSLFFKGNPIYKPPQVDEVHASITPLGAGEAFQGTNDGTFIEALHPNLIINFSADETADIEVRQAQDRVPDLNVIKTTTFSYTPGSLAQYYLDTDIAYYKIKVTNTSGSPMTSMTLHTIVGDFGHSALSKAFVEDGTDPNKGKIDVTGEFTPSGFQVAQKTTPITVTTSAAALLTSALSGRNSISIANKSTTGTIYVGDSLSVTADDTATGGWEIGPLETLNEPVSDSVTYFVIGDEASISGKVRELA